MHGICETKVFARQASVAGMIRGEIDALVDHLAANPAAGDEIQGTGGCRKIRLAGKGKSGGYRVISFFTGADLPVFLLAVFAKGEKANLTPAECSALMKLTAILVREYRSGPGKPTMGRRAT